MRILGIETSCDETAAAIVEDGQKILSNVVVSQIDIFAAYGGVIPEVAARSHLEAMMPVIKKALSDAGVGWEEIDAIAVTYAPGLLGSLLIGTLTARTLVILHYKPLYAVHHLKAHVYANWLGNETPEKECFRESQFPLVALVVSGGHTQILFMPGHNRFEIIGTTRDDAVGECFDKVAKILGLPYPGGPAISQAAEGKVRLARDVGEYSSGDIISVEKGDARRYHLPIPKVEGLDFSFSGLKTAVLRAVQKEVGVPISYPSYQLAELLSAQQVADFAASFQRTAVEILVQKLKKAVREVEHGEIQMRCEGAYSDGVKVGAVVLAGGVAANEELRKAVLETFSKEIPVFFPAVSLAGDNGAMVGAAAYYEVLAGVGPADPYKLNIYPRISVDE